MWFCRTTHILLAADCTGRTLLSVFWCCCSLLAFVFLRLNTLCLSNCWLLWDFGSLHILQEFVSIIHDLCPELGLLALLWARSLDYASIRHWRHMALWLRLAVICISFVRPLLWTGIV